MDLHMGCDVRERKIQDDCVFGLEIWVNGGAVN